MKYFYSTLLVSLMFTLSAAAGNVTFTFSNIRQSSGTIVVGVFNTACSFPKDGEQFQKFSIPVQKGATTYTLKLPKGDYAFAVYHDMDGNGVCDQNFFGIPTEGFAFSTNFRPKLKAPTFNDVKVHVDEGSTELNMKLIYM